MASIYKPADKNRWYISYIDPDTGKPKTKSTGLAATKQNEKEAMRLKQEVEQFIDNRTKELSRLLINKKTIVEAFKHFQKLNSSNAANTQYDYTSFYEKLKEKFNPTDPCTIINKLTAEDWIIHIKQKDRQPNTIFNWYKTFNKFLNFLFEYSYIPMFMINKKIKPRQEVKSIRVFDKGDLKEILLKLQDLEKNSNFTTMIYLLAYSGLRPSDIIYIEKDDINLDDMLLTYHSSKTNKEFIVPLFPELKPILEKRMNEIVEGRIFNYATVREMGKAFARYLSSIELNKKGYNLRTFRKSFATTAFESGIDIVSTSALLGHSNIRTTKKYYTHVARKKLSKELKKIKFEGSKKGVKIGQNLPKLDQ